MAALLLFAVCTDRSVNLYDEGLILTGAMRVAAGDLPHRDFYVNYGPAQFDVLALLFKLFSPSVLVERCWDLAVKSAIVVLVYRIAAAEGAARAGRLAALASIAWFIAVDGYGLAVFPALATFLTALLLLQPILAGANAPWRLFAAGLCVGVAGLFRYDVGGAAVLAVCLAFGGMALAGANRRRPGAAVARLVPFCGGVLAVVLPVAAGFVARGAANDVIFDMMTFPSQYYAKMRSLPFPLPVPGQSLDMGVYLPIVACAAAGILAVRPGPASGPRNGMVLLVALATLIFFAKGFVRMQAVQMVPAIVLALLLMALLASRPGDRSILFRVVVTLMVGSAVASTFIACVVTVRGAQENLVWIENGAPCIGTADIPRLACFAVDDDRVRAIRYIRQNSDPRSKLYVGLGRHDKILINDIAFYFLAARDSATKWHHMDPGLQTNAPIQREMIGDLDRNCPTYVVLESQWDDVREPNGSAVSSGVTLLDDFIHRTFTQVAAFGPVSILHRSLPCQGS